MPWWATSATCLVGVREDIKVEISHDGVLVNPAGDIVVAAFQDDQTLVRAHARLGVVVGKPVQPDGTGVVQPFATADWTT
jgi:hypothetical protein